MELHAPAEDLQDVLRVGRHFLAVHCGSLVTPELFFFFFRHGRSVSVPAKRGLTVLKSLTLDLTMASTNYKNGPEK